MPFVIAIVVVFFGYVAGHLLRLHNYSRLKSGSIRKPSYSVFDDISPLEFELIVKGRTSLGGLVGELAALQKAGIISFMLDDRRELMLQGIVPRRNLPQIQSDVLKLLLGSQYAPGKKFTISAKDLTPDFGKQMAVSSLRQKGWWIEAEPRLGDFTRAQYTKFGVAFYAAAVVFFTIINGPEKLPFILIAAVPTSIFGTAIMLLLWFFAMLFIGTLRKQSHISTQIRTEYAQQWQMLQEAADYMIVSGADMFTPDYATLDFAGLDPLYPYWVALGQDETLLTYFRS